MAQRCSSLDGGAAAPDALAASLDETELTPALQVHALCENARAVHHGENLSEYHSDAAREFDDTAGENDSVAGNLLANLDTLTAAGETFEEASRDRDLADRLIEALVAGDETGGDAREADAQSAAVLVADPTAGIANEVVQRYPRRRVTDATCGPPEPVRTGQTASRFGVRGVVIGETGRQPHSFK